MSRCVRTILKVLQNITPENEEDIHRQLASIVSSTNFSPPEMDSLHWERIATAYAPVCSPPAEGWQMFVCAILNDEHIDQIREEVSNYLSQNPAIKEDESLSDIDSWITDRDITPMFERPVFALVDSNVDYEDPQLAVLKLVNLSSQSNPPIAWHLVDFDPEEQEELLRQHYTVIAWRYR